MRKWCDCCFRQVAGESTDLGHDGLELVAALLPLAVIQASKWLCSVEQKVSQKCQHVKVDLCCDSTDLNPNL